MMEHGGGGQGCCAMVLLNALDRETGARMWLCPVCTSQTCISFSGWLDEVKIVLMVPQRFCEISYLPVIFRNKMDWLMFFTMPGEFQQSDKRTVHLTFGMIITPGMWQNSHFLLRGQGNPGNHRAIPPMCNENIRLSFVTLICAHGIHEDKIRMNLRFRGGLLEQV